MDIFKPCKGWGPERKQSALTITFDNLGEAAWLEAGMWTSPVGQHFTAAFVPKLVETLGEIHATYFIEASNAEIYPDAIRYWSEAGNEVGVHAWRHENWAATAPERRRDILQRSTAAMRSIGIDPIGFRPPGDAIPAETYAEIEEAGFLYCSDVGEPGVRRFGNLLSLPFEWPNVDSYNLEALAQPLRRFRGDPEEPRTLDQWKGILNRSIEKAIEEGGLRTVLFHPEFIGASDEKLSVVSWLIDRAKAEDMWIARLGDVAKFVADEIHDTARKTHAFN